jgi:septal ring factor EnvC (AmiA/AmiB activator)
MPRHYKVLGFLLVTMFGIYGCAKGPGSAATTESGTSSTAKVQKLEEEHRAALAARDHFRQKLVAVEEQQARTQQELEQARAAAAAERDALKNEVKARTTERDAVNTQYETFRKNLKELIGNADSSIGALNLPAPKPPADQGAQK